MSEFRSPCPASECARDIPCRPPAPSCPHPWHAARRRQDETTTPTTNEHDQTAGEGLPSEAER